MLLKQLKSAASCFTQVSQIFYRSVNHAADSLLGIKGHMLGHGDMGELADISHIPVADNIHRMIDMVNTILMLDNI